MNKALDGISSITQNVTASVARDMQALAGQIGAMGQTLNNAQEDLGGELKDVSDLDTSEDTTGKVENCINHSGVLGDLNAGGIVGAISFENDLDPEDDLQFAGDDSMNFAAELRGVVLKCENVGTVTVKKQNGGGIVGLASMGLVKESMNTGVMLGEGANYVGGIAGSSKGFIRDSSVKCVISGNRFVGGIAGTGAVMTDCHSMIRLDAGEENVGAVMGQKTEPATETEEPIRDNFYLCVDEDLGGIDGISYHGQAQSLDWDGFMELEGVDQIFQKVRIKFAFEDGTTRTLQLVPGEALTEKMIPELPEKEGYVGRWEGLDLEEVKEVTFDLYFQAVYSARKTVVESTQLRGEDLPMVLAQGSYLDDHRVSLEECTDAPEGALEAWKVLLPEESRTEKIRYALPEEMTEETVVLMVQDAEGQWQNRQGTQNGKYLVFEFSDVDTAFCILEAPKDMTMVYLAGGGALLVAALVVLALILRARKKSK